MRSKDKLFLFAIPFLLVGCATAPLIPETQVNEPAEPMEKRSVDLQRFNQLDLKTGETTFVEIYQVNNDGTYNGRNGSGCSWVESDDMFSPSSSWDGCSTDPNWVRGKNTGITQTGKLWPLVVGNTASYDYTQFNAKGENRGKRRRTCKVHSFVNITVASGSQDVYKVSCVRRNGDWSQETTWYLNPEVGPAFPVKFVQRNSDRGVTIDREFIDMTEL